jgi:drug/metabolite transporter (DMT)-like permease
VSRAQAAPVDTHASFAVQDWLALTGVALTWGGSFLLIHLGVEHFAPALVAFGRVAFGAAALALMPAARAPLPRSEWGSIVLLAVIWLAVPFTLFPIAQQWIESSLAGMINAATPLFTALVAAVIVRRLPQRRQAAGLVIGFLGVVAVTLPSTGGEHASALGAGLVLLATLLYGVAFNLAGSLQRRNGSLPVLLRTELTASLILLPVAVASIPSSEFAWSSLVAVAVLGAVGTALALAWFTTLIGRVGAPRGSITIYFVPVVAIMLGALLNDETVHVAALFGTALVLVGAYLTSRGEERRD